MFSINDKEAQKIRKGLLKKKETIALAESVTAGLLQFAFSTIPDASKFLQGGVTAFNLAQKYKHLQVEPLHALSVNCVSQKVAVEMAHNSCIMFSGNWGIGVTGYATPVPESDNKVFAFFAVVYNGKVKLKGRLIPKQKDPPAIQQEYVLAIVKRLASIF